MTKSFAIGFGGDFGRVEDMDVRIALEAADCARAGMFDGYEREAGSLPLCVGCGGEEEPTSLRRGEMCFCLLCEEWFGGGAGWSEMRDEEAMGNSAGKWVIFVPLVTLLIWRGLISGTADWREEFGLFEAGTARGPGLLAAG
jgi:hypothetical protein